MCVTLPSQPHVFFHAELLILGTGRTLRSMPPEAREWCRENMVNVEVLDTVRSGGDVRLVHPTTTLGIPMHTAACGVHVQYTQHGGKDSGVCNVAIGG